MFLFNTLTRKKEKFVPLTPKKLLFYHCGPTVYWTQHIGNLRGLAMGDLLVRTFRYFGYEVLHVRNYTDVGHLTSDSDTGEDKLEKGARREGLSPQAIADKYIAIFEADTAKLNFLEPNYKPRASEYIEEMQNIIQTLLDKGYCYQTDFAVYYDISKFSNYTQLSLQKIELQAPHEGKGIVEDSQKRHEADFALWFFKKGIHENALQTWESPWGRGFPGWHIECSAMSRKLLGKTLDIHFGGVEHIPVHHTNEIAQSEAANSVKFVNYWLHNEHLLIDGEKMAKSKGTAYSVKELEEKGFFPLSLRYFFLQAHYRSQENFTFEALKASEVALEKLYQEIYRIKCKMQISKFKVDKLQLDQKKQNSKIINSTSRKFNKANFQLKFQKSLEDDLNVPGALAVLWEVLNSELSSEDKLDLALDFDQVLGLNLDKINILPKAVARFGEKIDQLRREKKYPEADKIRMDLIDKGYSVESTGSGTMVLPKKLSRFFET